MARGDAFPARSVSDLMPGDQRLRPRHQRCPLSQDRFYLPAHRPDNYGLYLLLEKRKEKKREREGQKETKREKWETSPTNCIPSNLPSPSRRTRHDNALVSDLLCVHGLLFFVFVLFSRRCVFTLGIVFLFLLYNVFFNGLCNIDMNTLRYLSI